MREPMSDGDEYWVTDTEAPIHYYFELSYAQYLTIPRSLLQSMPVEWQRGFVRLLIELDNHFGWRDNIDGTYWVRLKDRDGKFKHDPLMDYDRGRRFIAPKGI